MPAIFSFSNGFISRRADEGAEFEKEVLDRMNRMNTIRKWQKENFSPRISLISQMGKWPFLIRVIGEIGG